ncbi:MAG: rRNA pseudouridine synthase [Deltaproteobacteria bacterium]|nr:rRNA pseudouridine synthase [Deltaproteobacteria bacterium]
MPLERLQKIIARSGHYSRRHAEELIAQGKVIVDGKKITVLGTKVDADSSRITVGGKPVIAHPAYHYVLLHKPRRCMVTRDDPEGRKTVYDYLPRQFGILKPVGRLDYDSEGLLLLTNDGSLAQKLSHPQFHVRKTYEVKVQPRPTPRQIERLIHGVMLDDGQPGSGRRASVLLAEIVQENPKSVWLKIELEEGRNRQIRRMCEKVGLTVRTLVRTSYGPFKLKNIPYGGWRLLSRKEIVKSLSLNI